jgi:hypothetical protein
VGAGSYLDNTNATAVGDPIIFTETNGVWATPVEAPGSTSFNPSALAIVDLLTCPSATTCVASGVLVSLSPIFIEPFFIDESNGVWSSPAAVPGVAALSPLNVAIVTSLSCGAPGDCTAVGEYDDTIGNTQAFVVNEVAGVWGTAAQLLATQLLGSGLSNGLFGVACPSAGNCTAVGTFNDNQGNPQPFYVDESNHAWSPAVEVPGVQALNANAGAVLMTISCSAVGACSAGGYLTDANTNTQAFLVNDTNGSWANPIVIPGSASLNKGGLAQVSAVSCSSDGSCGVQGFYTDANKDTRIFVVNSSAIAPTTVASAPRHVTAKDKKGVITVRWSTPANNGGAAITSYTVVSMPKSKTCVTHATACTFKGLNKKLNYTFEVRATNAEGTSSLSPKSNTIRDN